MRQWELTRKVERERRRRRMQQLEMAQQRVRQLEMECISTSWYNQDLSRKLKQAQEQLRALERPLEWSLELEARRALERELVAQERAREVAGLRGLWQWALKLAGKK